jgi:hypothetical protein
MKAGTLSLAVGLLFAVGCDQSEEDGPKDLFTLNVESTFDTSKSDDWVVVHDQNGIALEFKPFESGQEVVITTEKPVSGTDLVVTHVRYFGPAAFPPYQVRSYADEKVGGARTLKFPVSGSAPAKGAEIGSFKIEATLDATIDQYYVTDKFGPSCNSTRSGNSSTSSCNIYQGAPWRLVHVTAWGQKPMYKWIENVQPNSTVVLTAEDFQECPHVTRFDFPATADIFLFVEGREESQSIDHYGAVLHLYQGGPFRNTIQAGYVNQLTKYLTNFTATVIGGQFKYYNSGGIPPADVTWPNLSKFQINSNSITNFSASTTATVFGQLSSWIYVDPATNYVKVTWSVLSSKLNSKVLDLPAELLSQHPMLAIDGLVYKSTSFDLIPPSTDGENIISHTISVTNP